MKDFLNLMIELSYIVYVNYFFKVILVVKKLKCFGEFELFFNCILGRIKGVIYSKMIFLNNE